MNIPIIINNFNRLTTTRRLADSLANLGYKNITILDNASTYPRLLEYYDKECPYPVIGLDSNQGHLAIYNSGLAEKLSKDWPYIAYTDSDLEINPHCPKNFVEILIQAAGKFGKMKAGVALKIDDLPQTNEYNIHYKNWETTYWQQEIGQIEGNPVYDACVDSTFCIIPSGASFDYQAVRVAGNLTMRHLPWYQQFDNLDEEEQYFLDHCEAHVSTYKRFYLKLKQNNYEKVS